MQVKLTLPAGRDALAKLRAGDRVLLSGQLYTARDAAHSRIYSHILTGGEGVRQLDWLKGACIYYTGPCPAPPGKVIGSCGPTTSGRMDKYTPALLDFGMQAMIGKGQRSCKCMQSIAKNKAVYFAAIGGAGAYYSECVTGSSVFMYPELLSEAVYLLTVKDFPVVVAADSKGNSIYTR